MSYNIKKEILTIPNIITISRIVIIIFAGKYLLKGDTINSFILYLIAIITDFLDGFLARGLKQISNLGKILDPLADKLMIGSAVIILIYMELMPAWYGIIIIVCFLTNLIGGLVLIKKYKYVPAAILIGKIAAVVTMITFLVNILFSVQIVYLNAYPVWLLCAYIVSSLLLIISVVVYGVKSYTQLKTSHN